MTWKKDICKCGNLKTIGSKRCTMCYTNDRFIDSDETPEMKLYKQDLIRKKTQRKYNKTHKKCPHCNSTRTIIKLNGDLKCKKCGYINKYKI